MQPWGTAWVNLQLRQPAASFNEEEAIRFVAKRGKLMADLELEDFGAMAASMSDRKATEEVIADIDGVQVANVNHPRQTVISGTTSAVEQAVVALKAAKIAAKPLRRISRFSFTRG